MSATRFIARSSCIIGLAALLGGCVIAPPDDGYHDHDRPYHRYHRDDRDDHDRRWHECHDRDDQDEGDDSRCRD